MNIGYWTWDEIALEWTRDPSDRERQACWQLLCLLDETITEAFVGGCRPSGLDAERLLAITWSETEREIARAAVSLYNGSAEVNLGRVARRFSDTQLMQLEKALAIYRGSRVAAGWDVVPTSMPESTAAVTVERVAYPGATDGRYHMTVTTVPCGATVETVHGNGIPDQISESLRAWSACDHVRCRREYAIAWSSLEGLAPAVYRAMHGIGDGAADAYLERLKNGSDREQAIARELAATP